MKNDKHIVFVVKIFIKNFQTPPEGIGSTKK